MTELFWIFFLVIALQPVLRQKLLEASRNRVLKSIPANARPVSSRLATARQAQKTAASAI